MTNDERPVTPSDDEIDSLASRRLDGEIDIDDVPVDIRSQVERRVGVLSPLRSALRNTAAKIVVRDDQIASALAAATTSRTRRLASSRAMFAVAASIVGVVGVSALVLIGSDSDGADEFTEAVIMEQSSEAKAEVADMATSARAQEAPQIAEFGTVDDVIAFAESIDASELTTEPTLPDSSSPVCEVESTRPRAVRQARIGNRTVEIHVVERGVFIAYDPVDCSIVDELTAAPSSTSAD